LVAAALQRTLDHGLRAAAFSGGDGGKLREIADPLITVTSQETVPIQEIHILLGYILCAEVEHQLGLA
jgi:D-sedoheptulose 7-phosphate isomerase